MVSIISTALVLTFLTSVGQAAPTQTQSAVVSPSPTVEPPFVADPSGRGTVGLLTSCTVTLSLCVWTALHLNCYPPGTSGLRKHITKIAWAGRALIAPEYILFQALAQWNTARKLRDLVNKYHYPEDGQTQNAPDIPLSEIQPNLLPRSTSSPINSQNQQGGPSSPLSAHREHNRNTDNELQQELVEPVTSIGSANTPATLPLQQPTVTSCDQTTDIAIEGNQKPRWNLEHGFFAVMGGFQISVPTEYEWVLEGPERMLTPQGIEFFAKHGLLPNVGATQLKGRGKADQLAKALVCAQAIWMVIQTIARKASGLPVTLLELNTLAHVACAVFMYAVWWKKPQNVNEAFDVQISPRLGAALLSPFLDDFERKSSLSPNQAFYQRASNWEEFLPENKTEYKVEDVPHPSQYRYAHEIEGSDIQKCVKADGAVMLLNGQALEGSHFVCVAQPCRHLSLKQVKKLTSKAILGEGDDITGDINRLPGHLFLCRRASNHGIDGNVDQDVSDYIMFWTLTGLGVMYAGIHASSWNGHFPTLEEAIMWRVAVCYLGASGFIAMVLWYLLHKIAAMNRENEPKQVGRQSRVASYAIRCMYNFVFGLGFFLLVMLVLCKCYIVVESFISLRSLPIGSYSTVSWVNFLPHIG
jgi:hypothetical protein